MELNPNQQPKPANNNRQPQKAVGFMLVEAGVEFAVIIGAPLWIFIYFGQRLDFHFHTRHIWALIGIFAALFVSGLVIYRRILYYKSLLK